MTGEREPTDGASAREEVDALAADYLARLDQGEEPELASYLARLARPEQRAELAALVEAARAAQRHLPTPLTAIARIAGRYRVLEAIGSGGMGQVFCAWDERLCRRVAIKVLSALDAHDAERREMFLKESRLLAALQHPGIVAVHEAGQEGELSFLVMDLVDGRSLADVLDRARRQLETESSATRPVPKDGRLLERAIGKPLAEGRTDLVDARSWNRSAARIALELARILEAAHAQKVVHRDLKPQNVMLLAGASPVVLDFGLAGNLEAGDGAVTRGLYGSVAYLAPEQVASHRVGSDPRTDVYQLGLILYELLTLRRAFPGEAVGEVMERIRAGVFKRPRQSNPSVPRELEAICLMALESAPEGRYQSARELREDLERFLEGREPPRAARAWRVGAFARRARWRAKRHPLALAAAGMLVVAALAFALSVREPRYSMRAIRVTDEGRELVRDGEPVTPGDFLGVELEADAAGWLWGLSVFGTEDERRVLPVRPMASDDLARDRRAEEPWGLRVEEGLTNALCAEVGEVAREGLLLFASAEERPELEAWLGELAALSEDYLDGIPVELARARFRALVGEGRSRGKPVLDGLDPERLALLRRVLAAEPSGLAEGWRVPGWETFAVDCRVEGPR